MNFAMRGQGKQRETVGRIPSLNLVLFTRQLSLMLLANVPLLRALDALSVQPEVPHFGELIQKVSHQVESGHQFSKVLAGWPTIFPRIFPAMVAIGENTGSLDRSLDRLANWLERDESIRQKIRSSLSYPVFVLVLAMVLTLLLFYTVLPPFIDVFLEAHIPLPLLTQVVIAITQALRNPWCWGATAILLTGLYSLLRRQLRKPQGSAPFFRLGLRIPILGSILYHGSAARFCAAAEATLASGMDMVRVFRLAAEAAGSPTIRLDAPQLAKHLADGEALSLHLASRPDLYPASLSHMVAAGEEASKVPEMLARAASYHDLEMRSSVDALSVALEPLMLAAVASVVGTVVLSIFLPMYSFIEQLS